MKQSPQTIKVLVIAVIIAAVVSSLGILAFGDAGFESAKVFMLCICFLFFGLFAAAPLVVAERPEYRSLGIAGMFIPMLGFVLTAVAILAEIGETGFLKFIAAIFILSMGLAQICLLYHINVQNQYANAARMTATIAISLFTLLVIIRIFDAFESYESFLYDQSTSKIMVVAFLIDIAATILVPLCNRLQVPEKTEINFETPPADEQPEKQDS